MARAEILLAIAAIVILGIFSFVFRDILLDDDNREAGDEGVGFGKSEFGERGHEVSSWASRPISSRV